VFAASAGAQAPVEPPIRTPAVIVIDTPLTADAGGTTRLRFDETVPAATRTVGTIASRVANLHIAAGGAGSFGDIVTLRGLANTPYFSDPSVTLYFDDLPLGNTFTYPTGLFGFASATIQRGPQGTAFGRGGQGGTLVFSSTEPGPRAAGELRAGLGSYNLRTAAVEARSARTEKSDASVSAAFNERDGFIRNTELGTRVDDQQGVSAAARVRLRPTTTSELTFQLLGTRHRDGAQPLVPLGGPRYSVARGRDGRTDSSFGGAALKASFDTEIGRLTSTTSHTQWSLNPFENRLDLPPTLDSHIVQSQRIWNEELRLASGPGSPLTWHLAGWYSQGTTKGDIDRGLVFPFGTLPIEASQFQLDSRTLALFGEVHFGAADDWQFTAGLRAERTRREFERSESVPGTGQFTAGRAFEVLLPKLEARYPMGERTTVSASLALGARPGGWSAYTANPGLAGFKLEKATTYELGIETSSTDRTIAIAGRMFVYTISNFQIERSFSAADYLVVNAPRARSLGGEFEASWRPSPRWTLTATLGLTHVSLREFVDPMTGSSYQGNRAPYTPHYDWHLGATYRAPNGWFAGAEIAAVGPTHFEESQDPLFTAPAREIANARVGYSTARWRLSLYGENLGASGYHALIVPGVGHGAPGTPRSFGVEAAWKW
jgi:outer membrane receptor protein involved in Fe transport